MELDKAEAIAQELMVLLEPSCARIVIAGSIRRRRPEVGDIELLCIPREIYTISDTLDLKIRSLMTDRILDYRLNKRGSRTYGTQNKLLVHVPSGFGVDVFSTTKENWWVALVVRTGGAETNKRISRAALQLGYRFHAYGSGFSTPSGDIVCKSEREVFEAVGLPYIEPERRS